ncbi:MAG: HD-GYP domain-containing protein [Candidatus Eremiobacteraeota bacterium]|nr:HD-GYP domain-containing protein [Candidatus Eremiobacteraeota bacterium]
MKFGFLARFSTVLLVVTIGIAAALSFAFTRAHDASVQSDLVATAAGTASAKLQRPLDAYVRNRRSRSARADLADAVAQIENFSGLVRDVRVYATDGTPLFAAPSKHDGALIGRALNEQNITQTSPFFGNGEELLTAAIPIASNRGYSYAGVIAIDLSLSQMSAQTEGESRFIVYATVGASALIFLSLLTLAIAAQRELIRRRHIAETTFLQTMQGIAAIVDQRDPYTAGHSQRVADYSVQIARRMGLARTAVDDVRWAALLHDLGKIGVPDDILLKPSALDVHERNVIAQHPSIGHAILSQVEAMENIAPCVLHHHERWDGTGYPSGLRADAIPLLSRIIAVADSFDAMTTNRPYRNGLSVAEARARLIAGAASQWDAACVHIAVALIDAAALVPPIGESGCFGQRLARATATA